MTSIEYRASHRNRDRGQSRDCTPPTPPDIRVRIRRFVGLSGRQGRDGGKAERSEEHDWHGDCQRGTVREPPGAMRATGGLCRQIPADAAAPQFDKTSLSTLPLFPGDGAQPPPEPFV